MTAKAECQRTLDKLRERDLNKATAGVGLHQTSFRAQPMKMHGTPPAAAYLDFIHALDLWSLSKSLLAFARDLLSYPEPLLRFHARWRPTGNTLIPAD